MFEWFIPVNVQQTKEKFRALVLVITCFIMFIMGVGYSLLYLGLGSRTGIWGVYIATIFLPIIPFVLRWSGSMRIATTAFCCLMTFTVFFTSCYSGGESANAVTWASIVSIVATVGMGSRQGFIWLLLGLFLLSLIYVAAYSGMDFPDELPPLGHHTGLRLFLEWFHYVGALLAACVAVIIFDNLIRSSQASEERALIQAYEANLRLEQNYQKLKETQSQLIQAEKLSAIGQMVAGVAHEINSPRAAVDHYVVLIERQIQKMLKNESGESVENRLSKIQTELLPPVRESIERIGQLTDGLLNFTRAEHKEMKSSDMHQIIDSVVVLLRSQLQGRIEIIKQYGDIPPVVCYPGQMNQVFMNILTNAIQAIPGTGTITIATAMNKDKVEIRIKDTGIGMNEETKKKIFDPFFTTKEIGKGTGLGLSVVWEILQKHGAMVDVHTEQGKGSEFSIQLLQSRDTKLN